MISAQSSPAASSASASGCRVDVVDDDHRHDAGGVQPVERIGVGLHVVDRT
jgi:hypothetical protein